MNDLTKLRTEHAELLEVARRLREMIALPSPPAKHDLFEIRRQLAATLIGHLKTEDWVLYPRLLASEDPHIAATARAFSDEMGGLAATFVDYIERWKADTIADDWAGYCRDSGALIDALTKRIGRENRELYPLLEKLDQAA